MASTIMHIAVAKEVNKVLKRKGNRYLIGAAMPDFSKLWGIDRKVSHFINKSGSLSDDVLSKKYGVFDNALFLEEYGDKLSDDFVLGYYVHLYTDYLWNLNVISKFYDGLYNVKINNTVEKMKEEEFYKYIYLDYNISNQIIIDKYSIDLSIYEGFLLNDIPIKEISADIKELSFRREELFGVIREGEFTILTDSFINQFIDNSASEIIKVLYKLNV